MGTERELTTARLSTNQSKVQSGKGHKEYSKFVEASEVLIEFYKGQHTYGLERHFMEFDEWVDKEPRKPEENLPLIIEADEGVGKKTLLVKWIQHRQEMTYKVTTNQSHNVERF